MSLRTLVISDLHLGARSNADLLRRAEMREPLLEALDGVDRLVILGDMLELREVPLRRALEPARGLLEEAGRRVGEIVITGGNHDHALFGAWADARLQQAEPPPLGLQQLIEPAEMGPLARALAEAAAPARVRFGYPGVWLRGDVYATHGHYCDVHTTVPTFERLAAGAMNRFVARLPERATPDDYEAILQPLYAWMHALAQHAQDGPVTAGANASARVWVTLGGGGRTSPRALGLMAGFLAGVAIANRMGIGPVRRDLSGESLRRGGLHGIREAVRRLGITAEHVIWGHSHRAGPLPADDPGEWRAPTGARILNTGSWVYQRHFLTASPNESPYWPGTAIEVPESGPPRLRRLLGDRGHDVLRPPDLRPQVPNLTGSAPRPA